MYTYIHILNTLTLEPDIKMMIIFFYPISTNTGQVLLAHISRVHALTPHTAFLLLFNRTADVPLGRRTEDVSHRREGDVRQRGGVWHGFPMHCFPRSKCCCFAFVFIYFANYWQGPGRRYIYILGNCVLMHNKQEKLGLEGERVF